MTDSPISFPLVELYPDSFPGHIPLVPDTAHTGGRDNDQDRTEPALRWGQ